MQLNSGDTTTVGGDVTADREVAFTIGVGEANNGLEIGVGVGLAAGGRVGLTTAAGPLQAIRIITRDSMKPMVKFKLMKNRFIVSAYRV